MELTARQRAVFEFLRDYRLRHGRAPSYEEIRRHFGFASLNAVRKHLQQLERRGYIRTPWGNRKRAVELVLDREPEIAPAVALPLLGTVAAGRPLEAPEVPETIDVPASLLRRGRHFALRVRGDSMTGDGIHDGDVLVVRRAETAAPGETVVALVDGEATVKRYYPRGRQVELRPSSPAHEPLVVPADAVLVRGVVVGLFRSYA